MIQTRENVEEGTWNGKKLSECDRGELLDLICWL